MPQSRTKKALLNANFELCLELVTAICSFILPRLILSHFGSAYNGITQSITQFIGCVALLKSGIGSVTRAALYKPLAEKNAHGISEIVNATESFMRKIAVIFSVAVIAFAAVYPFIVRENFNWLFSFTLVLVLSISTFAQYFFGFTYQMVLQADQRNYIISLVTIFSTILNTCIASLLIILGASIHIVKLGSAAVFILPPFFYMFYVRRAYNIDKRVTPNDKLISQRWDAFGHQLANFINLNTDVVIVTVLLGVKEVSVYTVYYMIANSVKKIINAVSGGSSAAFGNLLARGENELLKKRFEQYEFLIITMATVLFTIAAILFLPFIALYTKGITDVNYFRPSVVVMMCLAEFFMCTKIPYEQIVFVAGHFKQTKNKAYTEAAINIVLSVICVYFFGLIGVLIGTAAASLYRMVQYHIYVSKYIIPRPKRTLVYKMIFAALCCLLSYAATSFLPLSDISSYLSWGFYAVCVSIITLLIAIALIAVMFRNEMKGLLELFISIGKRSKRK